MGLLEIKAKKNPPLLSFFFFFFCLVSQTISREWLLVVCEEISSDALQQLSMLFARKIVKGVFFFYSINI